MTRLLFWFFLHSFVIVVQSQIVSDSLWPRGLQHTRLPCALLFLEVCSDSYPLSQWCYLTISFSATPSPSALNLSQHQGVFQWVGSSYQVVKRSIRASASASVLSMNIHHWFPLGLTGFISLQSKGLSRVFSSVIWKHQIFGTKPYFWSNSHIHMWLLEKP